MQGIAVISLGVPHLHRVRYAAGSGSSAEVLTTCLKEVT